MPVQWKSSRYPGIRFYEHGSRKHGVRPDRYFAIRFQVKGKRKEEGLGWASQGWTEKKAVVELARLKEAARKGEGPSSLAEKRQLAEAKRQAAETERAAKERNSITFGQFWKDAYFPQTQRDKTIRTWKREESFFNKWLNPTLGKFPLKDISPIHLEHIKSKMGKAELAPRSISYCLDVIRQVFNRARALGIYEGDSPTAKVKKPKTDNKRLRFLTHDESAKLLDALAEKSQDLHDMALLSLHCGLRAGELFSLEWRDVNLEQGILTLWDTKNGKTRMAYLTSKAKKVLQARALETDHDLVFSSRTGGRRVQVSKAFRKVVTELGMNDGVKDARDRLVFHTLRHTFASWLVMAGTPLYTVGKLLGHSSSAMTERYSHLAPDHMKAAVSALEEAMEGSKKPKLKKVTG